MSLKSCVVQFTEFAAKQAAKLPTPILEALFFWKESVESLGLLEVRKAKGYCDQPLKGIEYEQRYMRVSKSYRLIYEEYRHGGILIVRVQEVTKRDY